MANIYGMLMDGMRGAQEGADATKKRGLAALVGQTYTAPKEQRQALFGQIATGDPALAAHTQKTMGDWDESKQAALTRSAQLILAAPESSRPQLWAQIVASGEIPGLSPQYDPIKVPEMAQKIVAMGGGTGTAEQQNFAAMTGQFTPEQIMEARMIQAGLKPRAGLLQVGEYAGGVYGVNRDPSKPYAVPVNVGQPGAAPQPAPQGGADVMGGAYRDATGAAPQGGDPFGGLHASVPGLRVTSQDRTQAENDALPNSVPNSYHVAKPGERGRAIDLGRPSPQQMQGIQQWAAQNNHEVITNYKDGHVHLEPRGRQQPQGGQLQGKPAKPAGPPSGYRLGVDGQSLEAIPGGPAQVAIDARAEAAAARKAAEEVKVTQKQQAAAARQTEAASAANQLVSAIDTLTKSTGFGNLGTAWGDVQINTPLVRNDAKDAQAQLKNVAGQVALTTMARLKALSTSGATGFGSLTAPELKLLENSIATLQSENISNAQLRTSLKVIRDTMEKTAGWKPQQQAAQPATSDIDSILDKYR